MQTNWVVASLLVLLALQGCTPRSDLPLTELLPGVAPGVVTLYSVDKSVGSGFVIGDGLVVTNAHMVARGKLSVTFHDGHKARWQTLVTDEQLDLAIGRVEYAGARQLVLRDQPPLLGETVYALGNPFGLGLTVTRGIVSAEARAIGGERRWQTDAAINPGNSGGPLVDSKGRVVGIVNARAAIGSGIGFAVPMASLRELMQQIPREPGSQ
ncbi:MAG: trypsin-like peptidase domain-containing protein [Candidatus Thiodiazotropha sp.]